MVAAVDLANGGPVDQRAQYAAWQAIQNPDMTNAGDTWAGNTQGYKDFLTNQYQQQYGAAPGESFDWSPTLAAQPKAGQLLQQQGDIANDPMRGQIALAQAKAFDPNATLDNMGMLQMDRSLLPKFAGGDLSQYDKYGGLTSLLTNNAADRVKDPRYVIHDPNYGDYTVAANLSQAGNDAAGGGIMGQMEKYMPSVVMAIMSAGMGAAAGPVLGALLSGAIGPGGIANKLAMGENVDWRQTGINMGVGALGGLANGYIPGSGSALKLAAGYADRGQ